MFIRQLVYYCNGNIFSNDQIKFYGTEAAKAVCFQAKATCGCFLK